MTQSYGFTLHFADPKQLEDEGYGHLAKVPFIRDSQLSYATQPNRFLIDLALGVWDPRNRGSKPRATPPTSASMLSMANWLVNALEWADTRGFDLMTCDYTMVLVRQYQTEMSKGIWSSRGSALQPATINARTGIAFNYQMWGADKGLREAVSVPTMTVTYITPSYRSSRSHEAKTVEVRQGRVRQKPKTFVFPSAQQVDDWREAIYKTPRGQTEGLLIDLILDTAIRREEAACWRVDTLPLSRGDWKIVNPGVPSEDQRVLVALKYGNKGPEVGRDHGDKIGPEQNIKVPLPLAEMLADYRTQVRPKALATAVAKGKTLAAQQRIRDESVHLFLNPKDGMRYTGKQIYGLWTMVECPHGWSPHAARHYWACTTLKQRMEENARLIQTLLATPNISAHSPLVVGMGSSAMSIIQLEIKPQLRHVSEEVTNQYVEWLFGQFSLPYAPRRIIEAGA
jgi:integrase